MQFGVSIIGCGDRGSNHAETWAARTDATVLSVYDVDNERAQVLGLRYDAAIAESAEEAIGTDGVNVVSVCIPTVHHGEIARLAAASGCHIFCEKPLALDLEDGRSALDAAMEAGVEFMPCFQHRDRSPYPQERRLYREGILGVPIRFRFTDIRQVRPKTAMHSRSQNGGVVIDMACHMTDMMRYITGEEPLSVYATGSAFGVGKALISSVSDPAVDEAQIDVTFSGGHQLQMYLNWGLPDGFTSYSEQYLIGPLGMAKEEDGGCTLITNDGSTFHPGPSPGTSERVERFTRAATGEETADVTGEDAFIALEVSLAALESIETGKPMPINGR